MNHRENAARIIPFQSAERTGEQMTLAEFFAAFKEPELIETGRAADTVEDYRRHVRLWQQWERKYRITNPVLQVSGISHADLLDWRLWLTSSGGISATNRTANKYLGSVQSILRTAAERGAHLNPPKLKPLETKVAARKSYLTYDQVDAIYKACTAASWPQTTQNGAPAPFSAAVYWRAFLVLQFNYGMRTQELWSYERNCVSIKWRQISWEPETPAPEGSAQNEHGWLYYLPQKQKRFKSDPLVLPLCETVARHLRSIQPPGGCDPDARIFPAQFTNVAFYDAWDAIIEASGVQLKADLKTGERPKIHIKLLRKTCETWHDTHAPGLGEIVTGHAERTVSGRHYANREMRLVEAVNALPQPASFKTIEHAQQSLF